MKNKNIIKLKIPIWFLIINIIIFSLFSVLQIIYFINNVQGSMLIFFRLLIYISSIIYIISAISFIILSQLKKYERISVFLTIIGVMSIILPITTSILNVSNPLISFIINFLSFLTLIISIIALIDRFIDKKIEYSNHFSVTKLIIFMILTLGLYFFYWYYRNLEYIEDYGRKDINIILRMLGLFVPFLNIFLIYDQFTIIKEINEDKLIKVTWSPGWMTFWLIFLYGLERFFIYFTNEDSLTRILLYAGTIFLTCIPLIEIQDSLNDYWNNIQKNLRKRSFFSRGEVIFIVIASLIWIIYLLTSVNRIF